jgi:anthranilate phosphoribosyltransferase
VEEGVVGEPFEIDPAAVGLALATRESLRGGDTATNVAIARRVLAGEASPYRDIVVLNAGAALVVAGIADDLAAGVERATSSIDDGRAAATLEKLAEVSNAAAP